MIKAIRRKITRPGCFCAKDCLDSVEMYKWWYTFTCTGVGVLKWTLLCCTGLYWAVLVCSGLYLAVPECSELYLVVLGSALL